MRDLSDLMAQRRPSVPTMDNFPLEVGRRLRLQRMAFKWRQADLAARAGVSVQTIKAIEKGQAVSSWNLLRILLALNQGADFLSMLAAPNFPNLRAHEQYVQLTGAKEPNVLGRRVRSTPATAKKKSEKA